MVVKKQGEVLKELPIEKISSVVIIGASHITSPLITDFLLREVPLTWLSKRGKFFGRLEPTTSINILRQKEQFKKSEDSNFFIPISKKFISAKAKNSKVILQRYNKSKGIAKVEYATKSISMYLDKIDKANAIPELMGYEGNVSKIYLSALGLLVKNEFRFTKRSKNPPRDPFNSLLSFGYTLLLYEIYTALTNRGLHPYIAFLHKIKHGHPALASDLIEEWRAVIVESLVMSLTHSKTLDRSHFDYYAKNGGVYLKRDSSKIFISKFEAKMRTQNRYLVDIEYPISFRESIEHQTKILAKAIEQNNPSLYTPILIR